MAHERLRESRRMSEERRLNRRREPQRGRSSRWPSVRTPGPTTARVRRATRPLRLVKRGSQSARGPTSSSRVVPRADRKLRPARDIHPQWSNTRARPCNSIGGHPGRAAIGVRALQFICVCESGPNDRPPADGRGQRSARRHPRGKNGRSHHDPKFAFGCRRPRRCAPAADPYVSCVFLPREPLFVVVQDPSQRGLARRLSGLL